MLTHIYDEEEIALRHFDTPRSIDYILITVHIVCKDGKETGRIRSLYPVVPVNTNSILHLWNLNLIFLEVCVLKTIKTNYNIP